MGRKKKEPQKVVNKVKEEPRFWSEHYTAEEWRMRNHFEKAYTDDDQYSCYVTDFEELNV